MKTKKLRKAFIISVVLATMGSYAQKADKNLTTKNMESTPLKTYLIEREIPQAGKLTLEQLKGISQKSNEVVSEMGSSIEWIQSYVTGDKVYCVYRAESEELIREHAERGGFPANNISELLSQINPDTGK